MDRATSGIVVSLGIGSLTLGTDFTGAIVLAVPIEQEYGVDITTTQWVLNVYALTFSMGLVTGGRLADMYGRRRLLRIGLAIFVLASLGCALAPTVASLIAARAAQGIGSAILWPCILGIASTTVREDERGYVIGLMIGAIGIGNSVGPVIAGVAGGIGEWRLFFAINVVFGIVTFLATTKLVPADAEREEEQRIDYAGVGALSLAIFGLLYAFDVGADWGWLSPPIIVLFVAALALFAVFPFIEERVRGALVPPTLMRNGRFLAALASNGLMVPSVFVFFLYMPQFYQKVLGWPMLWASLGIVPAMVCIAIGSPITGRIYNRFGPRRLLIVGYSMIFAASIAITLIDANAEYLDTLPAILVMGFGAAVAVSAAGPAAVAAVDPSRASLAGGLSFMVHLALGAIGVAAATAVFFAVSTARLGDSLDRLGVNLSAADQIALAGSARGTPEAKAILGRFSSDIADHIATAVRDAFTSGFNNAILVCLVFTAIGIVVAFFVTDPQSGKPAET